MSTSLEPTLRLLFVRLSLAARGATMPQDRPVPGTPEDWPGRARGDLTLARPLDYLHRYGDREAFRKAGELHPWLSRDPGRSSAVSESEGKVASASCR